MRKFTISILCLVFSTLLWAQAVPKPEEVLNYLKKNIQVIYLAKPNADSSLFNRINPEGVSLDTDGIMFGKKSNNKMYECARLLSALFKKRATGDKGGDGKLQDLVYQVLKFAGKPIQLVLVNDAMEPIQAKYVAKYAFDTTSDEEYSFDGSLAVWPGGFGPSDPSTAGMIILGESIISFMSKEIFLDLLSLVSLNDYHSLNFFNSYTLAAGGSNPIAANPADRSVKLYMYPVTDIRRSVSQGVTNAINFANTEYYRRDGYDWLANPHILVDVTREPSHTNGRDPQEPWNLTLLYQLKQDNLLRFGQDLKKYPNDFPEYEIGSWNLFALNELPLKYRIRNEMVVGMICDQFIRKVGMNKFYECLAHDGKKLLTLPGEAMLAGLFEHLCMGMTNDQTLAAIKTNPPVNKNYLFGLALLDLFSGFQTGANGDTFNQLVGGTIPLDLLNNYFVLVREELKKVADREYNSASGNKWNAAVDAIFQYLSK